MKRVLWGGLIVAILLGAVFYPRIRDAWEQYQAREDLRKAVAGEQANFEAVSRAVEESSNENSNSSQYSEAVNLVLNKKDSDGAFNLLFRTKVTEPEHSVLIELIIEERNPEVAKKVLRVIRLTSAQRASLEIIAQAQ